MKTPLNQLLKQPAFARTLSAIALMVLGAVSGTGSARAANQYYSAAAASNLGWSSSSSTNDWGNSSGGPYSSSWVSGNTAVLEGTAGTVTVGGGGNPTASGITFSTTGYTLSGGTINLTGTPTINPGNGSATATISSILAGAGIGITMPGSGTLTLSGANTYTGGTTINGGTLSGGNTSAFGTGAINLNSGATLAITAGTVANTLNIGAGTSTFNMTSGLTYSGAFSGSGQVTNAGTSFSQTRTYTSSANGGFTGTLVLERSAHVFSANNDNWSGANFQTANTSSDAALDVEFTGPGTAVIKSFGGLDGATLEIGPSTMLDVASGNITRITYASVFGNTTPVIAPAGANGGSLTSDSGTLTFNCTAGPITENSGINLVNYNSTTPLNLVLTGANTLTLAGQNTYSGTTAINGGLLQFASPSYTVLTGAVSGTGTNAFASGTILDLGGAGNVISLSESAPLRLAGGSVIYDLTSPSSADVIAMTGSPSLILSGTTKIVPASGLASGTYTLISGAGTITGTAANLVLDAVRGATASFTVSSPTVTMNVSGTPAPAALTWVGNVSGAWDLDATQNWLNGSTADYFYELDTVTFGDSPTTAVVSINTNVSPGSVTFNGNTTAYYLAGAGGICGAGALSKSGTATLTVSNANYFTGGTTVTTTSDISALTAVNNAALGTGPVVLIGGNDFSGTLNVNPGITVANAITMRPSTSGSGRAIVSLAANSALTGPITVDGSLSGNGAFFPTSASSSSSPAVISGTISNTGANANTINFRGSSSYGKVTGAISYGTGTVSLLDTTSWEFSGANTYGILSVGNASATLYCGAANALCASGVVEDGSAAGTVKLSNLAGNTAYSQTIAGLNQSVKVTTALGTPTLTLSNNTTTYASSGVISGGLSLAKAGTYNQILSGANTYTGATTISGGTLEVDGSLAAGSVVTVQNGGTLQGIGTINGPVTVNTGGTLLAGTNTVTGTLAIKNNLTLQGSTSLRINKTGGILANDEVTGLTGATYGGTLTVTNITSDGTLLAAGDTFTLFNLASGSYSGGFASIILPALSSTNLAWNTNLLAGNGTISVVGVGSAPLPLLTPAPGGYLGPVTVNITDAGTTIHYTTDGSNPTNSGTVQSALNSVAINVPLNTVMTVLAYASETSYANSAVVGGTYAPMSEGIWTNTAGGSWPASANWSNGVVGAGANVTADFSQMTMTANTTITLDGARTVGNLIFGDQGQTYNAILNNGTGGPLTLACTNTPTINVTNDSLTVNVTVDSTNGLITTGNGTSTFAVNPSITGGGGITVNDGTFEVTADNFDGTFTPLITVNTNGTIFGNNYHALGGGTSVIINHGTYLLNYEDYKQNLTMMDGLIASGGGGDGAGLRVGFAGGSGTYTWRVTNSVAGSVVNETINTIGSGVTLVWNVARGAAPYDLTLGGVISSPGSLVFTGNGVTAITAANSYTGTTVVSNGTLEVDGSIGSTSAVTVNNGASLTGAGSISGPVTVLAGATLAPGNTNIGTLGINNTLTLAGTSLFRVSKTSGILANDEVSGLSSLSVGGSLVITNVTSDTTQLVAGDTFQLFNTSASGTFASISLPPLPSGLSWDTTALLSSGSITIDANAGPPTFSPPAGTYVGVTTVTISSTTAGATIYYTIDGTTPTTSSPHGTTPVTVVIPINTTLTIQAYASATGEADSSVQSAAYTTIGTPTWTNPSGGSWASSGNWQSSYVPNGPGLTVDFSTLTLATSPAEVTLDEPVTIGSLIFADQADASTWDLEAGSGGPLTLNAGTNTPAITVSNSATTIGAVIAGTSGLAKAGAGTLVLSATNAYTGGTTVGAGTLQLGDGVSNDGSVVGTISNNTTLLLDNPLSQTVGNLISGSGNVVMEGSGVMSLSGANTYTGNTTINAGTLSGVPGAFGTGTINLSSNATTLMITSGTLTNTVNAAAGVSCTFSNANGLTFAGLFAGSGTITMASSTYLAGRTFSAVADSGFTGALVAERGTCTFSGNNANFSGADFQIIPINTGDTATYLQFTGAGTTAIKSVSAASGGQFEIGPSTTVNIVSGVFDRGTTSPSQSVIILPVSGTTSTLTSSGGTLTFGGASGTIAINAGVTLADYSVGTPLSVVQNGTETLTLAGTNTYTGNTTVNAGTLELAQPAIATGSTVTVASGAVLQLNFTATNQVAALVLNGVSQAAGVYNSTTGTPYLTGTGALRVGSAGPSGPATITNNISGSILTLTWPAGQGWRLVGQTNSASIGLGATWTTVSGVSDGSATITVDPTQPTVFYKLEYP